MLEHNRHIVKYLDSYVRNKNTKFAVMLKGGWGTGKSYFIEKYVERINRFEECETFEGTKVDMFTISAFGLSEILELENLIVEAIAGESGIFNKAISMLEKKTNYNIPESVIRRTKNVSKNIVRNMSFNVGIATLNTAALIDSNKKNVTELIKKEKELIIIVDDFERTNIEFVQVLGLCSRLIFESGIKIILVCNESKMIEENQQYKDFKEKVIGKEFLLSPDIETAISLYSEDLKYIINDSSSLKSKMIKETINKFNKGILQVFPDVIFNLRMYQYAFSDLVFFIEEIYSNPIINDEYVKKYNDYFEKVIYLKLLVYLWENNFFISKNDESTTKESITFQRVTQDYFFELGLGGSVPIVNYWTGIHKNSDFSYYANAIIEDIEIMEIRNGLAGSVWSKIVNFLEHLYDLTINGIEGTDDIRNKLISSDYYDAGEVFHYLCIVGFLKERGLTDVVLEDEFDMFVINAKPFRTRGKFNFNLTGYGQYGFLMPDNGKDALLKMKQELVVRNSKFIGTEKIDLLNKSSNIQDLTRNIEMIRDDELLEEIDISTILDDSHENFSPSNIVSELMEIDYLVGQKFISLLVSIGNRWNTKPLLISINNELYKYKEKHLKSLNVIKIDALIKDIGIS
nr:P-loop NTPase fold protein [Carnobacterium maltaromaticum]